MADITDYTLIRPGKFNPDLTVKSGTPVARPSNITDDPMSTYKKSLSNALGPNVFEGVSTFVGIVLLSFTVPNQGTQGDSANSKPVGIVTCMIPELHFGKPNPFGADSKTQYYKIAKYFYPQFEVPFESLGAIAGGNILTPGSVVQITFSDANLSVGRVTALIEKHNVDLSDEAFRGRDTKIASDNLDNQQYATPSEALATVSDDLGLVDGEEFFNEQFQAMVPGSRFTSPFGKRRPPTLPDGGYGSSNHKGIDLAAPAGTDIKALVRGEVIEVKDDYDDDRDGKTGYGNYIIVEHPDGSTSRYAHLNSVAATVGMTVEVGDPIAGVGSTGGSNGPHLDFSVKTDDGAFIDPLVWMAENLATDDNYAGGTGPQSPTP